MKKECPERKNKVQGVERQKKNPIPEGHHGTRGWSEEKGME